MILSSQLNEEIERIRFISNYDPTKLVTEQKSPTPTAKPQAKLTPQQIQAAKQKIQQQATKSANSIFQELMKAFDMDGDKVLTDYDGTNEGLAIAAIKKIKNKETLEALNKRIGATKQYKDLKSWLNAEMSDFDSEYGQIWSKLEKMGYAGANYNMLLKVAGYTPVGQLVKGADKAIDTLRGMTIDQIMEGFRDLLNGVGGIVVQSLLTIFGGPLGTGINVFAWAGLTVYDIYKATQGKINWWNIIIDVFSLITNGVAGYQMRAAKLASAEVQTAEGTISAVAKRYPKIYQYIESMGEGLTSFGSKIVNSVNNFLEWIITKIPTLEKPISALRSTVTKISEFLSKLGKAIKDPIGSKAISGAAKKGLTSVGVSEFIVSKAGQKGLEMFEKNVVERISKWLLKHAGNYTDEALKKQACKMGPKECAIYTTIEKGVLGGMAVGTVASGAGNIGKNTPVSDVDGNVIDFTSGLRDLKKGEEKITKLT